MRYCGSGLRGIYRDAHQFRTSARERCDLRHRTVNIGGVGIGHRLHDDGRPAADGNAADQDPARQATRLDSVHGRLFQRQPRDVDLGMGPKIDRLLVVNQLHAIRIADNQRQRRQAADDLLAAR